MHEHAWMKYGVLALGAIGLLITIGLFMNYSKGLEERTWIAQEMSVDGTMTEPIPESPPWVVFDDGAIGGSTGCNNYTGAYEASGGSMTIGPLATTLMACITPLQGQETAYLALLAQVDRYDVSGDELVLSNGDTELIRYAEGEAEPNS